MQKKGHGVKHILIKMLGKMLEMLGSGHTNSPEKLHIHPINSHFPALYRFF